MVSLRSAASLAAVLCTSVLCSASAQTNQSLTVVNAAAYSRVRIIQSYTVDLYQFNTNSTSNVTDPQLKIVVNATGNGSASVYCNPLWGSPQSTFPQPGNAIWLAEEVKSTATLVISPNDPYYRPSAAGVYTAGFLCSVVNSDAKSPVTYSMGVTLTNVSTPLSLIQQAALRRLYNTCCNSTGACSFWKQQNGVYNVTPYTNFCDFPGQVCDENGQLQTLDLNGINLNCTIPLQTFGDLTSLQQLDISSNPNLMGTFDSFMATIAALPNMQALASVNNPRLNGTFALGTTPNVCIAAQKKLYLLNVAGSNLSGSIPACLFTSNSTMVALTVDNNYLSGSIPNAFSSTNCSLQVLSASNNDLTGTIPASLTNCKELSSIDITSNMIGGSIPPNLGTIETLQGVQLGFNQLTGVVPDSLATALNLQVLDVKSNRLTGLAPSFDQGFPGMQNSSLVTLRVSFNNITGPLPTGIQQLPSLMLFIANNNSFSGTLPVSINMFPSLRALNVSNNQLRGSIPSAYGTIGAFKLAPLTLSDGTVTPQVFDVSRNQLTGALPSFMALGRVPSYMTSAIYLQGNRFDFTSICSNQSYAYLSACTSSAQAPVSVTSMANGTGSATPVPVTTAMPVNTPASVPLARNSSGTLQGAGISGASQQAADGASVKSSSSGLSGGAIAGIVIAAVVGVAALGALAFILLRRSGRPAVGLPAALKTKQSGRFEKFNDEVVVT